MSQPPPTIRQKRRQVDGLARFVLLVGGLSCLLVSGVLALGLLTPGDLGPGAADLNPLERYGLRLYLRFNTLTLQTPAGTDPTPIPFTVSSGETASQVADRLVAAGLLTDAQLLTRYMHYQGLDSAIEAGDFVLRATQTIPSLAETLTDARAREMLLRVFEGWRTEQIVAALRANPSFSHTADDFALLTGPRHLTPPTYPFLATLPPGASLEGYLYPDTYLFSPNASALDILNRLLAAFANNLPADYAAQVQAHGLSVHEAVILASLIEREAVVDDERPLIASVLLNRLAAGMRLEIDATVQYAIAPEGDNWWPPVAGLDFRAITSPYNTYYVEGLPTGPIANPRRSSLLAVAAPAETNYYFYRARCDGSGRHSFAVTYDEHLGNACP